MKKHLILLLVISIFINVCCVPAAVYATETEETKTLSSEMQFLKVFGIMSGYSDGTLGEEKTITRAELIQMVIRAMNIDNDLLLPQKQYVDVPDTHWASRAIAFATDLEIVKGDGNGYFKPDSPVSYSEVLKICLNVLGYGVKAEFEGGYPSGYIKLANEIELTDGIKFEDSAAATRGDVAIIFARMLRTEVLKNLSYNRNQISLGIKEGYNLLKQRFDVTIIEGKLDSLDGMTSYVGSDGANPTIDGVVYSSSYDIPQDMFAKRVKAYCKEDGAGVPEIVYIEIDKKVSELVVVDNDDISYSGFQYTYTAQNGREKTVNLDINADIIYNGRPAGIDSANYVPQNGYIKFIDNYGSGKYDSVLIYDYVNYVIGAIDKDGSIIYDKYVNKKYLDIENFNEYGGPAFVTDNGKLISPSLVTAGQVISVLKSLDGGYVYAEVQSKKVEGKVESITMDNNVPEYIVVNGVEYEARIDYAMYPQVGEEVTLYFDAMDRVASFEKGVGTKQYGYVIKCVLESAGDDIVWLTVLPTNGEITTYALASNVSIDKKPYDNSAQMNQAISTAIQTSCVIIFSLNSDGEIRTIDTIEDGISETEYSLTEVFDSGVDSSGEQVKLRYKTTTKGFGEKVYIGPSTVLFTIDQTGNSRDEIYTVENFLKNDGTYAVKAYSADKDDYIVPDAIVVTIPNDAGTSDTVSSDDLYVVTNTGTAYLDGDILDTITVSNGAAESTYYLMEENVLTRLAISKGDLVIFDVSADEKIRKRNIIKVFEYDTLTQESGSNSNYNAVYRVFTGYVDLNPGDGYISVKDDLTSSDFKAVNISGITPVVVSEVANNKLAVQSGNINSIVDYKNADNNCSFVVIRTYYSTVQQVFVFKK